MLLIKYEPALGNRKSQKDKKLRRLVAAPGNFQNENEVLSENAGRCE
jgi:hypothetical protein